jgi:hypothetical protein
LDIETFLITFTKPFDILAIVNDALEDFDETLRKNSQFDDAHFMHADLGGTHSGGFQEIRMALESKLDSCQLQTYLKGKANISYVDNKIQDLEKSIQNSRRVIFEDTRFADLQENVVKLLANWERSVIKNKEFTKCLSLKADRVDLIDQVNMLGSKIEESQTAIMALAQEATTMAEKRDWLEGNLRTKADRADTEALW